MWTFHVAVGCMMSNSVQLWLQIFVTCQSQVSFVNTWGHEGGTAEKYHLNYRKITSNKFFLTSIPMAYCPPKSKAWKGKLFCQRNVLTFAWLFSGYIALAMQGRIIWWTTQLTKSQIKAVSLQALKLLSFGVFFLALMVSRWDVLRPCESYSRWYSITVTAPVCWSQKCTCFLDI